MSKVDESTWQTFMQLVAAGLGQAQSGLGTLSELSRVAGSLVQQQVSSQAATLSESFDALRQFRRATAKKLIKMIIAYWSPEDLRRVAGKQAKFVPDDVSQWWKAAEFGVVVGEELSTQDQSQAALEAITDTAMWQMLERYSPMAVAEIMAPVIGGTAFDELKTGIEDQEPERLMQLLEEALGLEPGMLQGSIEQAQAGGEEVPA